MSGLATLRADELVLLNERCCHFTYLMHQRSPVIGQPSRGLRRTKGRAFTSPRGELEQFGTDGVICDHRFARCRQASLQYFTSCHTRSHFFRQVNGLPHTVQTFTGRFSLRTPRISSTSEPQYDGASRRAVVE